jgi:hypothetical protein
MAASSTSPEIAMPVTPANLALSDLALDAAIELDRYRLKPTGKLDSVGELARALSEGALMDLTLVPVYDKALASGGMAGASSKNDLYSRLNEIATKMQSTESATQKDIEIIRDFCVALHDALLTSRFHIFRQPILGPQRLA